MGVQSDSTGTLPTADNELVMSRLLDAPRALVYKVWTDPEHIVHWMQPAPSQPPVVELMEVRPGGRFRIHMTFNNGVEYIDHGVYREVVEGERLVYEEYCDEAGATFHRTVTTVTFEDRGRKTMVTVRAQLLYVPDRDPKHTKDALHRGWASGMDHVLTRLNRYLETVRL